MTMSQELTRGRGLSAFEALVAIDQSVLDAIPAAVFVISGDGVLVRFNRRATELWGRTPELGDSTEQFCGSYRLYTLDGTPVPPEKGPMAVSLAEGTAQHGVEAIIERPDGSRIFVNCYVEPLRHANGHVEGAINCFQDVTKAKESERLLHETQQQFRDVLDALPAAVYTTDVDGKITFFNRFAAEWAGREIAFGVDHWCISWRLFDCNGSAIKRDEYPMAVALKQKRALQGVEAVMERPDGSRTPFLAYPTPLFDESNQMCGAVNMLVDISDRKRAEAQRELLVAELSHRVKNTLASVVSIARQTFLKGRSIEEIQRTFAGRVQALAQTHTRLAETSWTGVSLKSILNDELAPYLGENGANVQVGGPNIELNPRRAIMLGMAVHELATNAAKHGALSSKTGAVNVSWQLLGDRQLVLEWAELGGPKVTPPAHSGFGSLLLERILPEDLRGTFTPDYAQEGLRCEIAIPLDDPPAGAHSVRLENA